MLAASSFCVGRAVASTRAPLLRQGVAASSSPMAQGHHGPGAVVSGVVVGEGGVTFVLSLSSAATVVCKLLLQQRTERAKRTTVNTRTPTHPPTHPSTHPGVSAVLVPLLPAAVLLVLDVAKRLPLLPPPLPPPSWLGGHAPPAQPRRGCLVHLHGPGAPRGTRRRKWGGGGRRRREKE